jgi:hypothetical protein
VNLPYRGEYEIEFSRSSAAYALLERRAPMSLERLDTATGAVAITLTIVLGGAACVGSLLAALWAMRA